MPAELATVRVPFRLRDSDGNFVLDTTLGNYNVLILKAGVTFVVTPTITTPGASLGRHLLSFLGGAEDDYQLFIDHVGTNEVSIEGGSVISDKFLSSGMPAAVEAEVALAHGAGDYDAAGLLDLASGVETGITVREALRGIAALLLGESSGGPGQVIAAAIGNDGTPRINVTSDPSGNHTVITLTL